MRIRAVIVSVILVLVLAIDSVAAGPCTGLGTVVVYGNGMFNTYDNASDSLDRLRYEIRQNLTLDRGKEVLVDLAYKTNEPLLRQLINVANQKQLDDYSQFWLWLSSLKKSPQWFQDAMKGMADNVLKSTSIGFDELEKHLGIYAGHLRKGYNVILVSHSQGNLYASHVMRTLGSYIDANLRDSFEIVRGKNPLFPDILEIFANVQVATPVSTTVNSSPWSTFKDDIIMDFVRRTKGALPANLATHGAKFPDGDIFGHSFTKAYLQNDESRSKILKDIQTQYDKLRYPIAFTKSAVMITHEVLLGGRALDHSLHVEISHSENPDFGWLDTERPSKELGLLKNFVNCVDLLPGISQITADTINTEPTGKKAEYSYQFWPLGRQDLQKEKPEVKTIRTSAEAANWKIGEIRTTKGTGKEPISVEVDIYPQARKL